MTRVRQLFLTNRALFFSLLIALLVGGFLASAWITMLIWGALANSFGFQSIGYGTACLVTVALSMFNGFFHRRG